MINAKAIFGGITIYVPADIKIKVRSTSIFGGVDDKNIEKFARTNMFGEFFIAY